MTHQMCCSHCRAFERCLHCHRQVRIVTDAEMRNPEFVRDVRATGFDLHLHAGDWRAFLLRLGLRFCGEFVDEQGWEVELDLEVFEPSDDEIDAGLYGTAERRITDWFDGTFCTRLPANVRPHVRREAWERFRVAATLLKAAQPERAAMWGVRPANDNEPD